MGRAEARDVIQGSDWQDGPKLTRYPVERWPITRDFVRQIPEEEKIAKNNVGKLNTGNFRGHVEHGDVNEFSDNEMEHTDAVLEKDVRRHVYHQVVHQQVINGQTGSHVRPQHIGDQEVQSELKNLNRLREILNSAMLRTNKYEKARRVVARILAAHKKSIPVGGEDVKRALQVEPTVDLLNKARDLMFVVSAWEVTPLVPKLESLGPVNEKGVWTCKGRLGKVIKSLLGKENLPILYIKGRVAEQSATYTNPSH